MIRPYRPFCLPAELYDHPRAAAGIFCTDGCRIYSYAQEGPGFSVRISTVMPPKRYLFDQHSFLIEVKWLVRNMKNHYKEQARNELDSIEMRACRREGNVGNSHNA